MKKILFLTLAFLLFLGCEEESSLSYIEKNFTSEEVAIIEANFPEIEGSSSVATNMNTIIESFVANAIHTGDGLNKAVKIEDAVSRFNDDFTKYAESVPDPPQPWEAFVDGEVTLNSPDVLSIAFNAYSNTGGAHGNSVISFLNFDPNSGEAYVYSDIIANMNLVSPLFEEHFKRAIIEEQGHSELPEDMNFMMPETIGFSEDGVIAVYNQHELEEHSLKMLEFTIPYNEVREHLDLDL